jgi:hypothetical protein
MNVNDMVLVSVDDHVVEPPDLFDGQVEGRDVSIRSVGEVKKGSVSAADLVKMAAGSK